MKKNFLWLLLGLCTLTFTACGDDDDDDDDYRNNSGATVNPGTNIQGNTITLTKAVGTWQVQYEKKYKLHNGVAYDVEMDYDPDWLIIKAEGTWEYWDYDDDTRQREFQGQGNLEIGENGIIMGNGLAVFTASGIVGNNMIVRYNEYDDDGTEYHEVSYIKVQ